jgi:chromate transporter
LRTAGVVAAGVALWAAPLVLLFAAEGSSGFLLRQGLFFSEVAVVSFGGAYAVLAYAQDRVVDGFGWLDRRQMVDGLALAETTPGPLILVLQFVACIAAVNHAAAHPDGMSPVALGVAASLLCLWTTFVPCFLWIFAGAPWMESIRGSPRLSGALRGVTAAAVGVIGHLSVAFALHVLFATVGAAEAGPLRFPVPAPESFRPATAVLAVLAGLALHRRVPLGWVLVGAACAGFLLP